ncbi:hypothetical protein [Nocardiopsis flavescens]|uniref:hypothetical protein n=1 Tax=Nocardiopsis flavescens TaxID=758803 RepID=UPI0009322C81|nr:hypothetical protein [Nocardiopsis flavescens]
MRSAQRSMYATGGLFLLASLLSCGQAAPAGPATGALVAAFGVACLVSGHLLRRPSRPALFLALGLQSLLLALVLALAAWTVVLGFWPGLVPAVVPLVLAANTLHLLYLGRGFHLRGS